MDQRIVEFVKAHENDIINDWRDLVNLEGSLREPQYLYPEAEWLKAKFTEAGVKCEIISTADNYPPLVCGTIGENLHTVEAGANSIIVDGKEITIYAEADASKLPWGEIGVDVVLECTGFYCSKDKSMAHINAGAKKVVISAPAGKDLKTIVFSVNEDTLTADDQIISAASCTTNCLAPMADTLNKYAPIQTGIMCTVHAYTGDQMILDGPHRKGDKRRARAGACNIVPNSTGAAKAIGLVIPELNGKLIGAAQRVSVCTGSTTILTAVVKGRLRLVTASATMRIRSYPPTLSV